MVVEEQMASISQSETSGVKASEKEVVVIVGEEIIKADELTYKGPVYGNDYQTGFTGKANEMINVSKAIIQEKYNSLDDKENKKPMKMKI